jgi:hypothetical protein
MIRLLSVIPCALLLAAPALAGPQSQALEKLTLAEKANARIELNLGAAAPARASTEAGAIEALWNTGQCQLALERFAKLEDQVDPTAIEICISWRRPVPAPVPEWGTDVLISAADSVYSVSLARDPGTGNLFAVLSRRSGATNRNLSMNFSSNGGLSWTSTLSLTGGGRWPSSVMVMGDYCYYAYGGVSSLRLRRVSLTTGNAVDLGNGSPYLDILTTTTDTIKEVKLAELWDNSQLCCGSLHDDGKVRMFWSYDSGGVTWQQFTSPESSARRGLDVCGNYPYSSYLLFSSYYDNANRLRVLGLGSGAVWDTVVTGSVDSNAFFSAVGAYRDTVLVAFENRVSGTYRVQDVYSVNGGSSWSNSFLTPSDTNCYCPDLALNRGGGMGMAYMQALPQSYRFSWWPYTGGGPSKSVIAIRAISTSYQTAVEYLDGDVYGVAYISATPDLNRAYFDRSDWVTGISGRPQAQKVQPGLRLQPNRPNPFRQSTTLYFQLPVAGTVRLNVYNIAGQLVRSLADGWRTAGAHSVKWDGRSDDDRQVTAGVYVCRLDAGGTTTTRKLTYIK